MKTDNVNGLRCTKTDNLISLSQSFNQSDYDDMLNCYELHRGNGQAVIDEAPVKRNFEKLVKQGVTLEQIKTAILNAEKSDYLQGLTDRPYTLKLSTILNPKHFQKFYSGYYDTFEKESKNQNQNADPDSYGVKSAREQQYEENLQRDYEWFYGDCSGSDNSDDGKGAEPA